MLLFQEGSDECRAYLNLRAEYACGVGAVDRFV